MPGKYFFVYLSKNFGVIKKIFFGVSFDLPGKYFSV